jgi:hypothetical protein
MDEIEQWANKLDALMTRKRERICWSITDHGTKPLGIMRHCEPVQTIQRSLLNASRRSCSHCGASSRIKVRQGATSGNNHDAILASFIGTYVDL